MKAPTTYRPLTQPRRCAPTPESNNEPEAWAQYSVSDLTGWGIGYFQPWGMAIGNNNNLLVGDQGGGKFNDIRVCP